MATNIDSLEVKINTTIGDCNQKLDRLISKLSQVSKALKLIQDGKTFEPLTQECKKAEASANSVKKASEKVIRSYEDIKKASESLINASKDKANGFVSSHSVEEIRKQMKVIQNAYDSAKVKLAKIDLAPKNMGAYEKATKDVIGYEAELQRLKEAIADIEARDMERTKKHNAPVQTEATSEELEREEKYLEEIRNQAQATSQSLETITQANKDIASSTDEIAKPTKTWSNVVDGLKDTMVSVGYSAKTFAENVSASMHGAKPSTEEWKGSLSGLKVAFQDLRSTVGDTISVVKNSNLGSVFSTLGNKVSSVGSTIKSKMTKTFDDMVDKSQELKHAFSQGLVDKGILTYTEKYASLRKELDKTKKHLSDLTYMQKRYLDIGGKSTDTTYKKYEYDIINANRELTKLVSQMDKLESKNKAFTLNSKTLGNAFSSLKNVGKGIEKTFNGVFGTIGKVGSALKRAIGHISLFDRETKKTKKSTDKFNLANVNLAKSLFKTTKMLKLMITRMILRKVITGVTDGFKNLAQYSDKVNASMSLLWNSFRQLGNSIASAVSPLLNAFAPAINKIIQLVVSATNYINQFLSALTGLSTWTKAKSLTDSYAESLDKTSASAKKANKQLQSFDALNNLTTQDSDTGTTSPADMFEEEEIDDKVKNFSDKVKDVFADLFVPLKNAWNNVGSFLTDSFKITAKKLKDMFVEMGKDFMEVWGEWKTQKMFENILLIVGRIVRTVGILADKFRIAWKYNNNGLRILRAIRDVMYTIVQWILNMVEATESWAKKLDLKPLLSAIAGYMESLNTVIENVMKVIYGFYTSVLLKLSKWTLEKGLPQFFDIMKKFNTEVDWNGLQEKINKIWMALEPFAEKVGQGLIDFFGYLMDKLTEFLNSDVLDAILSNIEDFFKFLTDFDWEIDMSALDESFTQYLESLTPVIESLKGILEDFVEDALKPIAQWVVGEGLPTLFNTLTELNNSGVIDTIRTTLDQLWQTLLPFAGTIAEGLIVFMGNVAKALDKFFKSEAWDWFIESLKDWMANVDADDIARGLEVLCKAFVGLKVIEGLSVVLTSIKEFLAFVKTCAEVGGILKSIGDGFSTFAVGLGATVSLVKQLEFVKQSQDIEDLNEQLENGSISVDEYQKSVNNLKYGEVIKEGYSFKQACLDFLNPFNKTDILGSLRQSLGKAEKEYSDFSENSSKAVGGLASCVESANNSIKDSNDDLVIKINDGSKSYIKANEYNAESTQKMKEKITVHYEDVEMAVSNCRDTMELEWNEISKNTDESTEKIDSNLKDFRDETFGKDTWTLKGIKDGLKESFENAISSIKEIWNKFAEWLNDKATFEINPIEIGGKKITDGGKLELFHIPTYSTGGFVEDGLFSASSSELVGKFSNGKTAVANNQQIVDGITNGVMNANAEQNQLLRQQNALLQGILDKEFGISSDALFRSVQTSANSYYKRTGNYAF